MPKSSTRCCASSSPRSSWRADLVAATHPALEGADDGGSGRMLRHEAVLGVLAGPHHQTVEGVFEPLCARFRIEHAFGLATFDQGGEVAVVGHHLGWQAA